MVAMSHSTRYLRDGEGLLVAYRRHALSYWRNWLAAALFIGAASFFLWPLLRLGSWGAAGAATLLLAGVLTLWRTGRLWRGNVMLVTNLRIIDVSREGFFTETVSEVVWGNIADVSWSRQGLLAFAARYGTVQVVATLGNIHFVFPNLPHPARVAQQLLDMRQQFQFNHSQHENTPS